MIRSVIWRMIKLFYFLIFNSKINFPCEILVKIIFTKRTYDWKNNNGRKRIFREIESAHIGRDAMKEINVAKSSWSVKFYGFDVYKRFVDWTTDFWKRFEF